MNVVLILIVSHSSTLNYTPNPHCFLFKTNIMSFFICQYIYNKYLQDSLIMASEFLHLGCQTVQPLGRYVGSYVGRSIWCGGRSPGLPPPPAQGQHRGQLQRLLDLLQLHNPGIEQEVIKDTFLFFLYLSLVSASVSNSKMSSVSPTPTLKTFSFISHSSLTQYWKIKLVQNLLCAFLFLSVVWQRRALLIILNR